MKFDSRFYNILEEREKITNFENKIQQQQQLRMIINFVIRIRYIIMSLCFSMNYSGFYNNINDNNQYNEFIVCSLKILMYFFYLCFARSRNEFSGYYMDMRYMHMSKSR